MNKITLQSIVVVSSVISIISLEELFSEDRFAGPKFNPDSISWIENTPGCVCCNCCIGCIKDIEN
jgi:hypothetical protein